MHLRASVAAILILTVPAAHAAQTMAAPEIHEAFAGITLDGIYNDGTFFSETYFEDGTIRYHDASGADSGEWSVRGDKFCTFYEGQQGACFFVIREGRNCFVFFEPVRGPGDTIVPRESWTSRGWNKQNEATCIKPPEAVI